MGFEKRIEKIKEKSKIVLRLGQNSFPQPTLLPSVWAQKSRAAHLSSAAPATYVWGRSLSLYWCALGRRTAGPAHQYPHAPFPSVPSCFTSGWGPAVIAISLLRPVSTGFRRSRVDSATESELRGGIKSSESDSKLYITMPSSNRTH